MRAMLDFVPNENLSILNLGFSWHCLLLVLNMVNEKVHKVVDHRFVNFLMPDLRNGECLVVV